MCGSAAIFAALYGASRIRAGAVLSDINGHVIDLLRWVQKRPSALLTDLLVYQNAYRNGSVGQREELFYAERDLWNDGNQTPARFVFLKTVAFNGLWRISKAGRHNAPWGKYKTARIFDEPKVRAWSDALLNVELRTGSVFETIEPKRGDLVYLDPPYLGTFSGYHQDGFGETDHERLLERVAQWAEAGVHVAYSNSLAAETMVQRLWPTAIRHRLTTRYSISRDGGGRKPIEELLVVE